PAFNRQRILVIFRYVPVFGAWISGLVKLSDEFHKLQEVLVLLSEPVARRPVDLEPFPCWNENLAFGRVLGINLDQPDPVKGKEHSQLFHSVRPLDLGSNEVAKICPGGI